MGLSLLIFWAFAWGVKGIFQTEISETTLRFSYWLLLLKSLETANKALGVVVTLSVSVTLYVDEMLYLVVFCSASYILYFWVGLGVLSFLFASLALETFSLLGQLLLIALSSKLVFVFVARPREILEIFCSEVRELFAKLLDQPFNFCYLDWFCLLLLGCFRQNEAAALSVWIRLMELAHHTGRVYQAFITQKLENRQLLGANEGLQFEVTSGLKALCLISLAFASVFLAFADAISSWLIQDPDLKGLLARVLRFGAIVAFPRILRPLLRTLLIIFGKKKRVRLISVSLEGILSPALGFFLRNSGFAALSSIIIVAEIAELILLILTWRSLQFDFPPLLGPLAEPRSA